MDSSKAQEIIENAWSILQDSKKHRSRNQYKQIKTKQKKIQPCVDTLYEMDAVRPSAKGDFITVSNERHGVDASCRRNVTSRLHSSNDNHEELFWRTKCSNNKDSIKQLNPRPMTQTCLPANTFDTRPFTSGKFRESCDAPGKPFRRQDLLSMEKLIKKKNNNGETVPCEEEFRNFDRCGVYKESNLQTLLQNTKRQQQQFIFSAKSGNGNTLEKSGIGRKSFGLKYRLDGLLDDWKVKSSQRLEVPKYIMQRQQVIGDGIAGSRSRNKGVCSFADARNGSGVCQRRL